MINEERKFSELERAILKTLAFFDIFDYPLTVVEIYKWLYLPNSVRKYQLVEIFEVFKSKTLADLVDFKNGFYFLSGRQEIIQTRLQRYQLAEKKFKIARRAVYWLRWLAFIKMIAVCNTTGYSNATAKSDIDFFIIVKKGRLWWSRLMLTLLAVLLGIRQHGNKIADRICLSFYITDDRLNLVDIALKPLDPYLVYWFATLAPIYDLDIYSKFLQANSWVKVYLPNFYLSILNNRRQIKDNSYIKFSKSLDELILNDFVGDWLERLAKLIQLKRIKKYLGEVINEPNTNVVITSSMLKFHKIDRRQSYRALWQKKLNNLKV